MVHQKAAPKRKTPSSKTMWAAKTVYKRPAITKNYRTGGYVGLERKFLDTFQEKTLGNVLNGATPMMDPSTMLCFNAVALGTGESKRQGRRIWMDTLEINFKLLDATPDTAAESSGMVRIWVVKDKQTNEAQMVPQNAVVDVATIHTVDQKFNILTFQNLQWKDRFDILYDQSFNMNAGAAGDVDTWGSIVRGVQVKLKIDCPVTYDTTGDGGTIATISDNSLHVIAITSDTTANFSLRLFARLRFRDQ